MPFKSKSSVFQKPGENDNHIKSLFNIYPSSLVPKWTSRKASSLPVFRLLFGITRSTYEAPKEKSFCTREIRSQTHKICARPIWRLVTLERAVLRSARARRVLPCAHFTTGNPQKRAHKNTVYFYSQKKWLGCLCMDSLISDSTLHKVFITTYYPVFYPPLQKLMHN